MVVSIQVQELGQDTLKRNNQSYFRDEVAAGKGDSIEIE